MPDNAALARAVIGSALYGRQHLLHRKHLLVTRHLALPAVKHGVGKRQLKQALRAQQPVQCSVLHRGLALHRVAGARLLRLGCGAFIDVGLHQLEQAGLHKRRQWLGNRGPQLGVLRRWQLFLPRRPKFGRRAHGGIARAVAVGRQHQLNVVKQRGDVVFGLVANGL